jgi:hypothetical protein
VSGRSGDDEGKRKREEALIGDYLQEREELAQMPRFHVPPFTIKRIEGTRTIYYAPIGDEPEAQLEKMRQKEPESPQRNGAVQAPPAVLGPEHVRALEPAPPRLPEPAPLGPGDAIVPRLLAAAPGRPAQAESPKPAEPVQKAPPEPMTTQAAAAQFIIPVPAVPVRGPEPAPNVVEPDNRQLQAALEEATAGGADVARLFEPARPVSFRKPFVKADTFGTKRTGLPPLPRRFTAKELIAKLRVVKEGVETREDIIQRIASKQEEAQALKEEPEEEPAGQAEAEAGEEPSEDEKAALAAASAIEEAEAEKERGAPGMAGAQASPAPRISVPAAEAGPELEQKTEGGKLCPSCGMPISEKNRLLICNDCGRKNCETCGRYEKSHMKSDVYYEYQFDWPLCLSCYEKAFTIQRMLGRSSVCYGSGNYSYALWYANTALQQDQESKYAPKARELIEKINKANKAAGERDREWRFARKQFSRQRVEDPRWRQ